MYAIQMPTIDGPAYYIDSMHGWASDPKHAKKFRTQGEAHAAVMTDPILGYWLPRNFVIADLPN